MTLHRRGGRSTRAAALVVLATLIASILSVLPASAVTMSGLLAWGDGSSGQLGTGNYASSTTPIETLLSNALDVSAGDAHTVILHPSSAAQAFGDNSFGQLGDGTTTSRADFDQVKMAAGVDFSAVDLIAAGSTFGVGVRNVHNNFSLWSWGSITGVPGNEDGHTNYYATQISTGEFDEFKQPIPFTGVTKIAAGKSHALAVRADGTLWAWGLNTFGELGNGTAEASPAIPVQVSNLTDVVDIDAGAHFSVALNRDADGVVRAYAWGLNDNGQLGDSTTTNRTTPAHVLTGAVGAELQPFEATAVAAGDGHALAVTRDGGVLAWGRSSSGQTGTGGNEFPIYLTRATPVGGATAVKDVSAGAVHSLALRSDGTALAWGGNASGQLGDGTTTTTGTPVAVSGLSRARHVAAGSAHSFAMVAPAVSYTPERGLDFGDQRVGQTSTTRTITFTNDGPGFWVFSEAVIVGSSAYAVDASGCKPSLPDWEGETCDISVTFTPDSTGDAPATLEFRGSNTFETISVPLTGNGIISDRKIAFTRRTNSNQTAGIAVMNEDGSNVTMLTPGTLWDTSPSWSPDGRRIAFSREGGDAPGIYVMGADGSNLTRITAGASDGVPTWSPDGSRLAFQRLTDAASFAHAIFSVDVSTSVVTQLTNGSFDIAPDWSPAGGKIAFTRSGQIYDMNVDGSGIRQLTTIGGAWSDYSPDATRIAFTNQSKGQQIYVVDADGTTAPVHIPSADAAQPTFAPDASRLAVESSNGTAFGIAVMNVDGSSFTRLTNNPEGDYSPSWQPETSRLTVTVEQRSTTASPSQFELRRMFLTPNAPGPEGLPPILDQSVAGLPPILDQSVAGLPPILDQSVAGLPPILDQSVAGLPPILDQSVAGLPLVDDIVGGATLPAPGGWDAILIGTIYEGAPLQNVTLGQVFALLPPAGDPLTTAAQQWIAALRMSDIDWGSSGFATALPMSLALGATPFRWITPPTGGPDWCSRFESLGFVDCGAIFNGLDGYAFYFQLAGGDLSSLPLNGILARDVNLSRAPLIGFSLAHIEQVIGLEYTPLGSIPISELPDVSAVVDCTTPGLDCATDHLAKAGDVAAIKIGARIRHLGTTASDGTFTPIARFGGYALGELVFTLLPTPPVEDLSYESLGVASYGGKHAQALDYHVNFFHNRLMSVDNPTVTVTLPATFPYVSGTAVLTVVGGPSAGSRQLPDPTVAGSKLTWALEGVTLEHGTSLRIDFTARPGLRTGTFTASASIEATGGLSELAVDQAPVEVGENFESNGDPATAPVIGRDTAYLTHVGGAGDVEYFRYSVPVAADGKAVIGQRVQFWASHFGNDNDLAVYLPAGLEPEQPLRSTTPDITLRGAPIVAPTLSPPPVADTIVSMDTGVTRPAQQIANDVPLLDTLSVGGISASHGLYDEMVEVAVPEGAQPGDYFTIQVTGYNQSHDDMPILLRAKELNPAVVPACSARTKPHAGETLSSTVAVPGAPTPIVDTSQADPTQTLFLISPDRLVDFHGAVQTEELLTALSPGFLARSDVEGQIISLDHNAAVQTAFAEWDADPCSITKANDVVESINTLVDSLLVTGNDYDLRSVVVLGTDVVIPHARAIDYTRKYNERLYQPDLMFTATSGGNALLAATARGYVVSDAAYGDLAPYRFAGGYVSVPQLAPARLVETPSDMAAAINRFVTFDGKIAADSALVAGYDSVIDGSRRVDELLGQSGVADRHLLDTDAWTATDLVGGFSTASGDGRDLAMVSGHYNHFLQQPASGSDLFPTTPVGSYPNLQDSVPSLAGSGIFTMSCHTALNVPDILVGSPTAAQATKLADWPQAYEAKDASFLLGASGYGYADKYTIGYGERFIASFTRDLTPGARISDAYVNAQQRYFAGLGVNSVYDNKVLQEMMLFGLPMYQLPGTAASTASATSTATVTPADPTTGTPASASYSVDPQLVERHQADGTSFFEVGTELPQVTQDLPIVARTEQDVSQPGMIATGTLITDFSFEQVANVRPSISRPIVGVAANEPSLLPEDFAFPGNLSRLGTAYTSDGLRQSVVLLPSKYEGRGVVDGQVVADLTKFGDIDFQVFYVPEGSTPDPAPPTFESFKSEVVDGRVHVSATVVPAPGSSPVTKVLALYADGNDVKQLWLEFDGATGQWTGVSDPLTTGSPTVETYGQAMTLHGSVSFTVNKNTNFGNTEPPRIKVFSPQPGARYFVGHTVTANYACLDARTGDATPVCEGTVPDDAFLDTSTAGEKTFTVTAVDGAGNVTETTVTYSVQYGFEGFLDPVKNDPYRNSAKSGQAIPVKWRLRDATGALYTGLQGSDVVLAFRQIPCNPDQTIEPLPDLLIDVSTSVVWDPVAEHYIVVVKTPKEEFRDTCQQMRVTFFNDPLSTQTADFEFK